jgi:hypothetical protein
MKRNTYTDFGAAYVGRMNRENPHWILHTIMLFIGMIWFYLFLKGGDISLISVILIIYAIVGLIEDWKKSN